MFPAQIANEPELGLKIDVMRECEMRNEALCLDVIRVECYELDVLGGRDRPFAEFA